MVSEGRQTTPAYPPRPTSLRLAVRYAGRRLSLISIRRVAMSPLPTHAVDDLGPRSGLWCELHDGDERVLYRRVLHPPLGLVLGRPYRAQGESATEGEEATGTLDLIVPDLPAGRDVVVFSSPLLVGSREAAKEIARFRIADWLRQEEDGA